MGVRVTFMGKSSGQIPEVVCERGKGWRGRNLYGFSGEAAEFDRIVEKHFGEITIMDAEGVSAEEARALPGWVEGISRFLLDLPVLKEELREMLEGVLACKDADQNVGSIFSILKNLSSGKAYTITVGTQCVHRVAAGDGSTLTFYPAVATDHNARKWIVTKQLRGKPVGEMILSYTAGCDRLMAGLPPDAVRPTQSMISMAFSDLQV